MLAGKNPNFKGPKNNHQIILQIRKELLDKFNYGISYDRIENIVRSFFGPWGIAKITKSYATRHDFDMGPFGVFKLKPKFKSILRRKQKIYKKKRSDRWRKRYFAKIYYASK